MLLLVSGSAVRMRVRRGTRRRLPGGVGGEPPGAGIGACLAGVLPVSSDPGLLLAALNWFMVEEC